MYTVKKQSKWKFNNSANTSVGISFVSGALGTLTLKDPDDFEVDFSYGSVGGGVSWGPNLNGKEGADAIDSDLFGIGVPWDWASSGDIWISSSFEKDELTVEDFTGLSIVVELSVGLPLASLSAMEMWFGIPTNMAPKELFILIAQSQTSVVMSRLLSRRIKWLRTAAKGRLRIGGVNGGLSLAVGATLSLGSLGKGIYKQNPVIKMPSQPNNPTKQAAYDSAIVIAGDSLFNWDEAAIKPEGYSKLLEAKTKIQARPKRKIQIIGHTDNTEKTPGYNQKLSERRANAVKLFLMGGGVASTRIITEGRGATEPVADNNTKEGRAKNRRVEIFIMQE